MAKQDDIFKNVISHAKEYGFIFPSSEIYDGLSAVYDYAQNGAELKKNIRDYWWKAMVQMHENIVGIDSAIFMHPKVWKASGHIDGFNDPMIDNKDSKKRYRADVLIEEKAAQYEAAGDVEKAQSLLELMGHLLGNEDLEGVRDLIIHEEITCPVSGTSNWTEVRQFNLMFSTQVGSVAEESQTPQPHDEHCHHGRAHQQHRVVLLGGQEAGGVGDQQRRTVAPEVVQLEGDVVNARPSDAKLVS